MHNRKRKLYITLIISTVIIVTTVIIWSRLSKEKKSLAQSWEALPLNEQIQKAREYFKQHKNEIEPEENVDFNMFLSSWYQKQHEYSIAIKYLKKAEKINLGIGNQDVQADIHYRLAANYLELGDYIKSYEQLVLTDSLERNFGQRSAETLNLLGSIYEKTGLYVKSLVTHFESFEMQKMKGNKEGIANSLHNLGHIYMISERPDKAFTYYKRALNIYKNKKESSFDKKGTQWKIAKINLSIGNYYMLQNDSTSALKHFRLAYDVFEENGSKTEIAQTFFYLGNVYLKYGRFDYSKKYYSSALEIYKKEKHKPGLLITELNLARIYLVNNQLDSALLQLKEAYRYSSEIGAKRKQAEALEMLFDLYYEHFPDSIESIRYYTPLYFKAKKLFDNEQTQDSLIQMSIRHEVTIQKNEEIAIEKYRNRSRAIIGLAIFIVLIISGIFIYFQKISRQKRNYEKKLAMEQINHLREVVSAIEKERKRIAVDLHDSLGQMLSTTKLYLSGLEEMFDNEASENQKLYSDTINLLDESCGELRNISYNIMPGSFIKYGLIVSINDLVNRINSVNQIKVIFKNKGFDKRKEEGFEISIYRIIQETLNNILKHAKASEIQIELNNENKGVELMIQDNGIGMREFNINKTKGLGWKSIYSRVKMLNGDIDVKTELNKGTRVEVKIPL